MKYLIKDTKTKNYYKGWTGIGPSMGANFEEAHRFADRFEAIQTMGKHSTAFSDSTVISERQARIDEQT